MTQIQILSKEVNKNQYVIEVYHWMKMQRLETLDTE